MNVTAEQLEAQNKDQVEDLFIRLIEADRRGRHFFILSRTATEWALENLVFGARHKSHLIGIKQQYAMRGALPKSAEVFLEINFENHGVVLDCERAFRIGAEAFLEGGYTDYKSALVLEDIVNDSSLYSHVLGEARKLTNVPSFSFEPVHAGGSRITPVFDAEIAKNKVVCCLVDTDMVAPWSSKGGTAIGVLAIERRRNTNPTMASFVGSVFCTVGHELENCIPYDIVKELAEVSSQTYDILGEVVTQNRAMDAEECFWLFFDVKNGLNGAAIMEKYKDGHLSEASVIWMRDKLGLSEEEFQGTIIDGFGNNIVQRFLQCPKSLKEFHEFTRTDYWKSLFLAQFETLLWFIAAPPRERI